MSSGPGGPPLAPPRAVPVRRGRRGALAAAHPTAADTGVQMLRHGGNAVDAAIAAQAVICVVMPQAASLGGDVLALVRQPDGWTGAVNGAGASAAAAAPGDWSSGGASVTVPGLVAGWGTLHSAYGRLPLAQVLAPAVGLARNGFVVEAPLLAAAREQRPRLLAGGAQEWALLALRPGDVWRQPALAELLHTLGHRGTDAFYAGEPARAVAAAVQRDGGWLTEADLAAHRTDVGPPVSVAWAGSVVHVQPPMSQGVLLAMALRYLEDHAEVMATGAAPSATGPAHLLVELTEATFGHRSACAAGAALLDEPLVVDRLRAAHRGGPRAYLHTAGVAAADAEGQVVSSLVSVFDDFGSAVFVPELGLTLNNRAAGFTDGANAPGPGRKPVHTLAPALVEGRRVLALATPGADGQVQTLLQILVALRERPTEIGAAVAALRWRTESGSVLLETGHPARADLASRDHRVVERSPGDSVFGGVVVAGIDDDGPFGVADWRRQVSAAAA